MRNWRRVSLAALTAGVVGAGITVAVSVAVAYADHRGEKRLLKIEVEQAAAVLQVAVPAIQTPLASAAQVAATVSGSGSSAFRTFMAAYVGSDKQFAGASLWRVVSGKATLVGKIGSITTTAHSPAKTGIIARAAKRTSTLAVDGPIGTLAKSRIVYSYGAKSSSGTYVVYAETALPPGRHSPVPADSPFSVLRYAIYLGSSATSKTLIATNSDELPVTGRTVSASVPFGTSRLTFVAASHRHIGSDLAQALWWIVLLVGGAITLLSAFAAQHLVAQRGRAENLSTQNTTLLLEQRSIAGALQQAVLPKALPDIAGVTAVARYVSGTEGMDIGGDWYDVITFADGTFFFAIGDVSGRGVDAGSTMAALRFASRAFAAERITPNEVLDKLRALPELAGAAQFATALCGTADPRTNEVLLANAGHLVPLVVNTGTAQFVDVDVSPPIGVGAAASALPTRIRIEPGATLLLYTDGLVERRGETLREGMERLRFTASQVVADGVESFVDVLLERLSEGRDDDTAVLALRWEPR